MEKRLKDYLKKLENIDYDGLDEEKRRMICEDLLIQIGFFQHERLVHLIVTVLFALLTMMSLVLVIFDGNIAEMVLMLLFFVLLVPYVRHYYILENGVQKLYTYYDWISRKTML